MANIDIVDDNEELYRNIRANSDEYDYIDGKLVFTSQAFTDRNKEPSVDRAKLKNQNPRESKMDGDGIVSLISLDVRHIGDVYTKEDENTVKHHSVDIIPRPTIDNDAHAQIEVNPKYFGTKSKQKNAFKLLRISLARMATIKGWTIAPEK